MTPIQSFTLNAFFLLAVTPAVIGAIWMVRYVGCALWGICG